MPYPIDNPALISYTRYELRRLLQSLSRIMTLWSPPDGKPKEFLPKEEFESEGKYRNRVLRTPFENKFRETVTGFTGLFKEINRTDLPESFKSAYTDCDLRGNSFPLFLNQAITLMLRDSCCAVLCDSPRGETGRPYLKLIERRDVINWGRSLGATGFDFVVLREMASVRDGYGLEYTENFRLIEKEAFYVYRLTTVNGTNYAQELIESGPNELGEVPLCWLGAAPETEDLPLLPLADMNISLLQKTSDLGEVIHRCNLPVPVREGARPVDGRYPPLVIGPNTAIEVPEGGRFYFAEPSGNAISSSLEDIRELRKAMEAMSLAAFSAPGTSKTALQVQLEKAVPQSVLFQTEQYTNSCLQEILRIWCGYTGEPNQGGMTLAPTVLKPEVSRAQMEALKELPLPERWKEYQTLGLYSSVLDIDALALDPDVGSQGG